MTTTLKRKARKLQQLTGMSYQAARNHIIGDKAFAHQGKVVTPSMLLQPNTDEGGAPLPTEG